MTLAALLCLDLGCPDPERGCFSSVVFSSCRRRVDIRVSNSRYMDCSNSFSGHLQQCGGNMLTATALVMLGEAVI
jgi:hypothetical protein